MLNKKTSNPIGDSLFKKSLKIYEKITLEQARALKEYWELNNYIGFNEYIQRTGSKISIIESKQVVKNTQFLIKLQLENFSGIFNEKCFGEGLGKNKKEARRNALSQIINSLIEKNLLVNIDHFQMECINQIIEEKNKNFFNIDNPDEYSFNENGNSNNLFCKLSNFIQQEKDIRLENLKIINNDNPEETKKMVQIYSKKLSEGKIEDNNKILNAIENLCKLENNNLQWNDLSLTWYQYLINGDKENLENILKILFSEKNKEYINSQIKHEILDSLLFISPYIDNWKKITDLLNTFFNNVSYFNEDIPFTEYYCYFKKSFHIELLDTLFHLFRNEGNQSSLNLINNVEVIGQMEIIGSRFAQEICTFIPIENKNLIKKIVKEKKTKLISETEIVSLEINNKRELALISKINNDLSFKLRKNITKNPENIKFENIKIQKILNIFVYQRTLECFSDFCINDNDLLSNELRQIIIGSFSKNYNNETIRNLASSKIISLPKNYKVQNQNLNKSQINAIEKSLTERLTLILGPPGTGKTITCVEIINEYVRLQRLKNQEERNKILVCTESNCAIDIIYSYLKNKNNISVYRYNSKDNSDVLYGMIKSNIITSNVILCTNVGSSNEFLKLISFPFVIIDECSQATELSTLIPLLHHCNQLVLIGDHKQLPPTIISNEAVKLNLNKSLFERLFEYKINSCQLDTQYRMHSSLFEFSSKEFYDNKILNGIDNKMRVINHIKFPNPNYNIIFYNINGGEQIENKTNSCYNEIEVNKVIDILNNIQNNINDKSIGIITPYDSQKNKIKKALFDNNINNNNIIVDTIDGFQGMERDIIIVSLVRSNNYGRIGFVNDNRRVNVLLTRAKYCLIVIGDENCLKRSGIWKKWIEFVYEKNLKF